MSDQTMLLISPLVGMLVFKLTPPCVASNMHKNDLAIYVLLNLLRIVLVTILLPLHQELSGLHVLLTSLVQDSRLHIEPILMRILRHPDCSAGFSGSSVSMLIM